MAAPGISTGYDPVWHAMLSGEDPWLRRGRWLFKAISPGAVERCGICFAPFEGWAAPLMRAMGRGRWLRNPHFCDLCETFLREHRGGTEIEIGVLFADVRGSTSMAARMRPAEFGALMQRFYRTATKVLTDSGAAIDKLVGDEVIGLYLPGLVGSDYGKRAVRAGLELLRATGHAEPAGPWLAVGVGVHAGVSFVGSIGVEAGAYEFTALGDMMNRAARLVAAAEAGELLISDTIWPEVAGEIAAESRTLELKGIDRPVTAHVARVGKSSPTPR